MRGRASGFGARISSIVLLITLAHRTNHAVKERDFLLSDAVLLVENLVGPVSIHRKPGNEGKAFAVQVLRVRSQRDEEAHELRTKIGTKIPSLRLTAEPTDN